MTEVEAQRAREQAIKDCWASFGRLREQVLCKYRADDTYVWFFGHLEKLLKRGRWSEVLGEIRPHRGVWSGAASVEPWATFDELETLLRRL